jgi:hypothetical protein
VRVQQRLEDEHRLVVPSERSDAHAIREDLRRRQGGEERLHSPLKVEVVVNLLHGRVVRESVKEAQRAQAGLDPVRHEDASRDVRSHFHFFLLNT